MQLELRGNTAESVSGAIERVTFHNADNGFCVLQVHVRGRRDLVTVVGRAAMVSAGELVHAVGRWENDRQHGLQFKATELRLTAPSTAEGIEKYLSSGMVRGIGPHFAKKLVSHFGAGVFDVIEKEPGKLREVDGIGPLRAERIVSAWAEQKSIREIMVFLHSHGVGTSRAVRIFKTYGNDAVALITENPYRLARDIWGIGFLTADAIAQKVGIARDAPVRARAGLHHVLSEATASGHCALPRSELLATAEQILEIPRDAVDAALAAELAAGELIADTIGGKECVFAPALYHAERGIARQLADLSLGPPPWGAIDARRAIPWVEQKLGIELAASQRAAVERALSSKVLVLTGGPGVGKTTLVNAILRILSTRRLRVALCAPTGRAARRLSETSGMEAQTIHRLLAFDPQKGRFSRDETDPLACDLLIVDETSMVDVQLMHALLRATPLGAAVLFVGDVDQLPSVGPGKALEDLIASGALPVVRLTEVFRQAAQSRIIRNAHAINQGQMPDLTNAGGPTDFYFVEIADPAAGADRLLQIVKERIPRRFGFDPIRDVQVLCPMNRGTLGAQSLNLALQQALNPKGEPRISRFGWTFASGDKVMQIRNNYDKEVFNGDVGFVTRIDSDEQEMHVDFDGRTVKYSFDTLDELVLAYATTIHKAQGSEYPAVVIPVTTQHYTMLQRNLLYTGVTRGKRLVVLLGQKKAVAIAVKGVNTQPRWTKLAEWLSRPTRTR